MAPARGLRTVRAGGGSGRDEEVDTACSKFMIMCLPIYPVDPVTRMAFLVAFRSADSSGLRKMLG
jgi:hypothetical protein